VKHVSLKRQYTLNLATPDAVSLRIFINKKKDKNKIIVLSVEVSLLVFYCILLISINIFINITRIYNIKVMCMHETL